MYIDIDDMYYIHSYSAVWIKFNLNCLFLNILKTITCGIFELDWFVNVFRIQSLYDNYFKRVFKIIILEQI